MEIYKKIKPCPFCGSDQVGTKCYIGPIFQYRVFCECGVKSGYYETTAEAIKRWNRRTNIND